MAETSFEVILSPRAEDDLMAIARYTMETWGAARMAAYMGEVDATIRTLQTHPERGQNRERIAPGLKSIMHATDFYILYRVRGANVEIARVLHTRRSLAKAFSAP